MALRKSPFLSQVELDMFLEDPIGLVEDRQPVLQDLAETLDAAVTGGQALGSGGVVGTGCYPEPPARSRSVGRHRHRV